MSSPSGQQNSSVSFAGVDAQAAREAQKPDPNQRLDTAVATATRDNALPPNTRLFEIDDFVPMRTLMSALFNGTGADVDLSNSPNPFFRNAAIKFNKEKQARGREAPVESEVDNRRKSINAF